MTARTIEWVDLGDGHSRLYRSYFQDTGLECVAIETSRHPDFRTMQSLKSSGFTRIGSWFLRPGREIRMSEITAAFPGAKRQAQPLTETRLAFEDETPRVLEGHLSADAVVAGAGDSLPMLNSFQAKYVPASAGGEPIAAIPLSLAEGTIEALQRVRDRHGDIDAWVRGELEYPSLEAMHKVLSPEQIDAVALSIDGCYEESGAICADQTGLGKGRVGAALARWAALNDRRFVFLTEKANLFTDFIRDVMDTDSLDIIGTPYILNDGARVLDQTTGEVLFRSLSQKKNKEVIRTQELPEGTKMVMATYSQFNKAGSPKSQFFTEICEGAHLHADESHNAAGEGSNTSIVFDQAVARATSFSYSSATHAKRAANLKAYMPLLPQSVTRMENMTDVLGAGGMPLLEALSQMLARTGRLIRREHDLSDMTIPVVVDEKRTEDHEALSDQLAPILSELSRLSMDISTHLEKKTEEPEAKDRKEVYYAVHWGVRFSGVIEQFISACGVEHCIEQAVDCLRNDKKPVIVVQNTMEAVLREVMTDADGALAGYLTDNAGSQRSAEFKDVLKLLVDRSMTARMRRGKDDPVTIDIEDPELEERARQLHEWIEFFPRMPISPMDAIIEGVEAEGRRLHAAGEIETPWSMGEISARGIKVASGEVIPTQEADRNVTINQFQHGHLDGIVLTQAASTGLSLHAKEGIEDQRVRRMLEFQIPKDPVDRVQFWGRIKRRGGVNEPEFACLSTGMSLQLRSLAAQNKKVEALSANVSGSGEAAVKLDVPDPINALGDRIARRVLQENPQVAAKMSISLKIEEEESAESLYYVNKILSRLALVSSSERDAIYSTFLDAYQDAQRSLASKGIHPTRPRELPGRWREVDRALFDAGTPEDGPVFGAPVYLTTIEREEYVYPISRDDLLNILEDRKARDAKMEETRDAFLAHLKDNRKDFLKNSLPKEYRSVVDALNSRKTNMVKVEADRLTGIERALKTVRPGIQATVTDDNNEPRVGVLLGMKFPRDPADYHKASSYLIDYLLPGDEEPRRATLATLRNDPAFQIHKPAGTYQEPYTEFENLESGKVTIQRKILDGNAFMATILGVQSEVGTTTRITMEDGRTHSAVLIPVSRQRDTVRIPGRTTDPDVAFEILREGGEVYSNSAGRSEGMIIERDGPKLKVTIPGKKSLAKPYQTPEIEAITGKLNGDWRGMRGWIDPDDLTPLAEALGEKGMALNFAGLWRSLANEATLEKQREAAPDTCAV
ncbi:strawberry notch C-terminal domain-containing protein [Salipiger mucosus]|uniref:Strawberry notch helicase C domain-containing protein n=1 Tax=Salipiger mucosus DSM 16094 TaxID=1123237 RepID=S9QVC1_9RHOB|nr:strawberry notch C-terminal domain-containing protein [Salipiger mucosus]EPX83512.1 hypothetical protein Salmuc_02120 [Salipiger mucosus DSM 16094]